ncbi:hypothetical protein EBR03_06350 [bacterium]|nr:hypothetical protein [bacterium]
MTNIGTITEHAPVQEGDFLKFKYRITERNRCLTVFDDSYVGVGVKTQTREERIKYFVDMGADKADAIAVIDAEDSVNRGMQFETFGWAMQMARIDKVCDAREIMFRNISKRKGML